VSWVAFPFVLPMTLETRFMTPAVAPTLLLAGAAVRLRALVARTMPGPAMAAPFLMPALILWLSPKAIPYRVQGYTAGARSIPRTDGGTIILLSSDSIGGGAFIAARLQSDTLRQDVMLRHNKVLSHSTWSGKHYTARYQTVGQIDECLRSVPIRYIAFDETAASQPAQVLLRRTLGSFPDRYVLLGRFPIRSSSGDRAGKLDLYRNRDASAVPGVIEVNTGPSHSNMVLQYRRPGGKQP
jgi:hypothetical protein